MQISQIFTSSLSYIYSSSCEDKSNSLKEAMLNLDVNQISSLLNQGVNPATTAVASESFKEKLADLLIDRFFNKTCCLVFLNGLENDQLTSAQQKFKQEVLLEPNRYSEQECKVVCLQILQENLSKEMLPVNIVNIALLTKDHKLTEKLVELKVLDASLLPSRDPHTKMFFKLFSPKPSLELFEKLIENGYPKSEILNKENQENLEQTIELYSNFLPPYTLVYKLFLNH